MVTEISRQTFHTQSGISGSTHDGDLLSDIQPGD
jgi:hypothetical protein